MKALLEDCKAQLTSPLWEARRRLLIILNVLYISLVIFFLTSEKFSTGNFVPDPTLYLIYIPAVALNLFSAIYNIRILKLSSQKPQNVYRWEKLLLKHQHKLDQVIGWTSIVPIMFMSFCNMIGVGNPSNDAILTDFALAQSLIIGAVIIIGRKGATAWFVIVLGVLFWDVSSLGWNYQYHYLTKQEAATYKSALMEKKEWALKRESQLKKEHLNPPKVTRYFNTWLVFIIVAFMAAYFFSGITIDILKIVPSVIHNIESAIEGSREITLELENKKNEITKSAMRIARYKESLEAINREIDNLDYADKRKISKVTVIMKKALAKETEWETFETNFDSVHNNFFKTIQSKFPMLSSGELKHLAFIKMNLSSLEISKLMDIKIESLRTLRYRLKKKLGLKEDIDLRDFVDNIEVFE